MATLQSRMVHSKTHGICPIHTRNIGLIGPLFTLNRKLALVWYDMDDSKSYSTRKMVVRSSAIHSKTHRASPIHTRNIGLISPFIIQY